MLTVGSHIMAPVILLTRAIGGQTKRSMINKKNIIDEFLKERGKQFLIEKPDFCMGIDINRK